MQERLLLLACGAVPSQCNLVLVCVLQEMAVRALKQTGSRSIEAALEYISKMSYLDPRNEQIVRVIKQTSPGKHEGGFGGFFLIVLFLAVS